MNTSSYDSSEGLATLEEPSGKVPSTRMESALDAGLRIQVLLDAEKRGRSQRRALVKGLVDGNPPYRPADLRAAGRAHACNVNWRVAEFYLNMARFAFYDVFSETPTFATCKTDFGDPGNAKEWGDIITEEYDKLIRGDKTWDRVNQFSIYDMVLYGCGPLVFKDEFDWRNEFVQCANLIVPDFSPSEPHKWEEACILRSYLPTELYQFIRNEKAARDMGWDIKATKKAIMQAHQMWQEGGKYKSWEWHQQQLKNASYYYGSQCKTINCAHYYFKEFPEKGESEGRITHCILINPEDNQAEQGKNYLFRKIRRFGCWNEIVHPMYYDNDGGGYHHSVTGLGVKMYSAMEYQNRLLCNLSDKTFMPKVLFKPMTAQAEQQLSIVQFAEFGRVPAGFDVLQTPIQSHVEEGMAFNQQITSLIASNLSQYRALQEKSGNPITAYEASIRASEQSKLGRTQLNHYYNQMDWLLQEKFRRAANPKLNGFMPGGTEAVLFRQACQDRGVPAQAMKKVTVMATRTVGQGSQFMRQQAIQQLLSVSPMFPNEGGKMNLVSDYVAAVAGQSMVSRYIPKDETPEMVDQLTTATLQVAAAKDGVPPVVGGSQNHYVFARTFLSASVQALKSTQQGGNPMEVLQFLDTIGPALVQHLDSMRADPSRQKEYKEMVAQTKMLEQQADKLKQQVQKQQQAAAQDQQNRQKRQAQVMTDAQLDQVELQNRLRMQQEKTDAMIRLKEQKQTQSLALSDASVASDIQRKNAVAVTDQARKKATATAE